MSGTMDDLAPFDAETVTEEEVVLAAEVREVTVPPATQLPAVQAAAVAATSFVAGAATLALARRHTAKKAARRRPKNPRDMLPVVGSRSFLVDVHLLSRD
jgi:hypothetical protein